MLFLTQKKNPCVSLQAISRIRENVAQTGHEDDNHYLKLISNKFIKNTSCHILTMTHAVCSIRCTLRLHTSWEKEEKKGLRELTKSSFSVKQNSQGCKYLELNYNKTTKKSQGDDINEMNDQAIILAQPGNGKCPIYSYKLYMSKLTEITDFFSNQTFFSRNLPTHGISEILLVKTLLAKL